MPEEITFSGVIKDGKSAISFKNSSENLSGLIDVYFFNSIADPSSTTETPLTPAKLVFWTTKGSYNKMYVSVQDNAFGPFIRKHKSKDVIDENDVQEMIVYVKPGIIDYGKGSKYTGRINGKAGRVNAEGGKTYVLRIK